MAPLPLSHRRAFSLIEAAIVLGIVGLVIGGIWVAARSVNEKLKVADTIAGTIRGLNAMRNAYPPGTFPTTLIHDTFENPMAMAIKAFPDNWV